MIMDGWLEERHVCQNAGSVSVQPGHETRLLKLDYGDLVTWNLVTTPWLLYLFQQSDQL